MSMQGILSYQEAVVVTLYPVMNCIICSLLQVSNEMHWLIWLGAIYSLQHLMCTKGMALIYICQRCKTFWNACPESCLCFLAIIGHSSSFYPTASSCIRIFERQIDVNLRKERWPPWLFEAKLFTYCGHDMILKPVCHMFLKGKVTLIKNAHNLQHHFGAQFFIRHGSITN